MNKRMSAETLINVARQTLTVRRDGKDLFECRISSAANGTGNKLNSFCTPLGKHIIRAKVGEGLPAGAVLRGRRWTGDICDENAYNSDPDRDWILTRILWLSGCELGHNRLGDVDTMKRYIYIHGAPQQVDLGKPQSRGCIRVSNEDVLRLFELLPVQSPVNIISGD